MPGRPGRRDVQGLLIVPDRAGQQVLQPVRPAMPAGFQNSAIGFDLGFYAARWYS